MALDYVTLIRSRDTSQILAMLTALEAGRPMRGWQKGKAFEHIVLRAFEIEGADVRWPFEVKYGGQTVEQIDGVVYSDSLACLIEAKDYRDAINIEPIAKLRNQLSRRPVGTMGVVFARSGFTEPAKLLTRMMPPLDILLWEFQELEIAVQNRSMRKALQAKYRNAVEEGIPDYNITELQL